MGEFMVKTLAWVGGLLFGILFTIATYGIITSVPPSPKQLVLQVGSTEVEHRITGQEFTIWESDNVLPVVDIAITTLSSNNILVFLHKGAPGHYDSVQGTKEVYVNNSAPYHARIRHLKSISARVPSD